MKEKIANPCPQISIIINDKEGTWWITQKNNSAAITPNGSVIYLLDKTVITPRCF